LETIKTIDGIVYKFKTSSHNYCVKFKKYSGKEFKPIGLTDDVKLNKIITNNNDMYYLNWGTCDKNDNPIDDINTGSGEEVYVFNSVFAIIEDFIKEESPGIIFYKALEKRKSIYDKMFNKINIGYIIKHAVMNTFLIKKELIWIYQKEEDTPIKNGIW